MIKNDDVILFDDEIKNAGTAIKNYCTSLSELIEDYCAALIELSGTGIKSDQICAVLEKMAAKADDQLQYLDFIGEYAKRAADGFIQEVDAADQFLY